MVRPCLYRAHMRFLLPIEGRPPEVSLAFPTLLRSSRRPPAPSHTHLIPMAFINFSQLYYSASFGESIETIIHSYENPVASWYGLMHNV
jgi:hypothetical protein